MEYVRPYSFQFMFTDYSKTDKINFFNENNMIQYEYKFHREMYNKMGVQME